MARCEDYPCCGHTDGLGCDYTPDRAYIYAHSLCDHEVGYCQMDDDWPNANDDQCNYCGEFMNYTHGFEGTDYLWGWLPAGEWVNGRWDTTAGTRHIQDCRHIDCFPEGTSLDPDTAEALGVS